MDNAYLISLIDLTSLNDSDVDEDIQNLCQKAFTPLGHVAAVCVYPRFVKLAAVSLSLENQPVLVATVANFPSGNNHLEQIIVEIETSLANGADEIDLVAPYQDYINGDVLGTRLLVKTVKALCQDKCLKVILESGAFSDMNMLYALSSNVLEAGADFIKTSTGKIATGATVQAAEVMLRAIQAINPGAGLKISGGVRTKEQAMIYVDLARDKMGEGWCTPEHLRLGASALLDVLVE